ncbi:MULTISPECIES: hypothetical protein [Flavobacteriaceae]|uniref:hypothetical protein n=1 Tax=Flavobacteriaceae TaxID=49546 RepID=UPI00234AB883|nr:hypothetical protein [Muricauda sp. SP22]MDC6362129.1 hypothetical protein [Muricauda sp. SP22]
MTYTVITLATVSLVLFYWLYVLFSTCFHSQLSVWSALKENLVPVMQATILSTKTLKMRKFVWVEALIVFENFCGHPIQRTIRLKDRQPHLNRFLPGKVLHIGLDPSKRPNDPIQFIPTNHRISFVLVLFCCFFMVAYIIGYFYLMAVTIYRINIFPERYERIFASSAVWQLSFVFVIIYLFLRWYLLQNELLTKKSTKKMNWDLLYSGLGAKAIIQDYKDTGVRIQKNPKIEFTYTFLDLIGRGIQGTDVKTIHKKEMGALADIGEVEIMYIAHKPGISRLVENLENKEIPKIIRLLIQVVIFVLSILILLLFYQDMFQMDSSLLNPFSFVFHF